MTTSAEYKEVNARLVHIEEATGNTPAGYTIVETVYKKPGEYIYFGTFVASFGEAIGPVGSRPFVARLWANGQIIYDRYEGFIKPGLNFKFYPGTEEQGGVYRDMNYRGLMTCVFKQLQLTDYGNNLPAITAEIVDGEGDDNAVYKQAIMYTATRADAIQLATITNTVHRFQGSPQSFFDPDEGQGWAMDAGSGAAVSRAGFTFTTDEFVQAVWFPEIKTLVYTNYQTEIMGGRFVTAAYDRDGLNSQGFASFDLGGSVNSEFAFVDWKSMGRFKVTTNGVVKYYVMGFGWLDSMGGQINFGALYVADGYLRFAMTGTPGTPWFTKDTPFVSTIVAGEERNGSSDVYIHTQAEIGKVYVAPNTGTDAPWRLDHAVEPKWYEPPAGKVIRQVFFDSAHNRVLVMLAGSIAGLDGTIVAINADKSVAWETDEFTLPQTKYGFLSGEATSDLSAGSLVLMSGTSSNALTYLDTETGDVDLLFSSGDFDSTQLSVWDSRTNRLYTGKFEFIDVGTPPDLEGYVPYTAAQVMQAYAEHVGFDPSEIITVNMDHMALVGYVVSSNTTITGLAGSIGSLYGFNWFTSADTITFKSVYDEDGNVIIDLEIDPERLAFVSESSEATSKFQLVRNDDNAAPASIFFSYFDIENDFKEGLQKAQRSGPPMQTHNSTSKLDFTLPISMDANQAITLLYGMMARAWAAKVAYTMRLPSDYLAITPLDALIVEVNGFAYLGAVSSARTNADYSVTLSLSETAGSVHPAAVETQPPTVIGNPNVPARVLLFDLPDTNPAMVQPGFLNIVAIAGSYNRDNFRGAVVDQVENANPTITTPLLRFEPNEQGYTGTVLVAPGAWPQYWFEDTYNQLIISADNIPASLFVTADEAALDAGANLVVIGIEGNVELIQFANFEALGNNKWRLYNLRRGRNGTDPMIGDVGANAHFAFMLNIKTFQYPLADLLSSKELRYRYRNPNQPSWQAVESSIVPVGNSRKPYAAHRIIGYKYLDTGEVSFVWHRRARFTNNPPLAFTPQPTLDESNWRSEIEIYGEDFSYKAREEEFTLFESDPNGFFLYDATMQAADFFTLNVGDTAYLRLYQIDSNHGLNGFTLDYEVPIVPIFAFNKLLSARFSYGGALETDVTIQREDIELAATISGGGELTVEIPEPVMLSAVFEYEGELGASVEVAHNLLVSVDAGGELGADLQTGFPISFEIDAGGELGAVLRVVWELGGSVEAGGALSTALRVVHELGASIDGGGSLSADFATPQLLSGVIDGGGAMRTNIFPPTIVSGTIEGGGAVTVDLFVQSVVNLAATIGGGGTVIANVDQEFSPPNSANLLYWFKADDGVLNPSSVAASDGDRVATFTNHGTAEDATQATSARRPTYRTGGLNGKPYIDFNAANTEYFTNLAQTEASGLNNVKPKSVFVVWKANNAYTSSPFLGSPANFGGKVSLYLRGVDGANVHTVKTQTRAGDVVDGPVLVTSIVGRNAIGGLGNTGSNMWTRQNQVNAWASNSEVTNLISTAISSVEFMRNTGFTTAIYADGELYEMLWYSTVMTDAQILEVENYLMDKYAISSYTPPDTAPGFVESASRSGVDTTGLSAVGVPASTSVGDVMVLACRFDHTGGSLVPTSGGSTTWTHVGTQGLLHLFTATATSGDAGNDVSVSFTDISPTGAATLATVSVYNKNSATSISVIGASLTSGATAPSVSALNEDIVVVGAAAASSGASGVPAGYVACVNTAATGSAIAVANREVTATETTPTATFTNSPTPSASFVVHIRGA